MKTAYFCMNENQVDPDAVKRAGRIVADGGLVAFPTETVYGLGADALNPEAAKKIYAAKGRPSDNPLIVHIAKPEDLSRIAKRVPEKAKILADRFWPGPLTMIFSKKDVVPKETTGGLDTVAVRMPDNRIALAFIEAAGGFVAAPSANLSGRPSPTCGAHVKEDMDGRIDMILDGGECGIGLESTIVDLTGDTPVILRPGYISIGQIEEAVGEAHYDPAILKKADPTLRPKAPGMKYRHYAPRGDLTVISGPKDAVVKRILEKIKANAGRSRIGVIASDETSSRYSADLVLDIGPMTDEEAIARHLYAVLRRCDEEQIDLIYSESFEGSGIGAAIMNRLIKAAGYKMEEVS